MTKINEVRADAQLSLPDATFVAPAPLSGQLVRSSHIQNLRTALQ
jgi:hypothetical protein